MLTTRKDHCAVFLNRLLFRFGAEITVDQLVDVVLGNRMYKPCLYLYNKIDTVTIEEVGYVVTR